MTVRRLGGFVLVGMLLLVGSFDPYYGGSGVLALALAVLLGAGVFLARAAWRGEDGAWLLLATVVGTIVTTAWEFLRPRTSCPYLDGSPNPSCEAVFGFWNVYVVGAAAALVVLVIGWLRTRSARPHSPVTSP